MDDAHPPPPAKWSQNIRGYERCHLVLVTSVGGSIYVTIMWWSHGFRFLPTTYSHSLDCKRCFTIMGYCPRLIAYGKENLHQNDNIYLTLQKLSFINIHFGFSVWLMLKMIALRGRISDEYCSRPPGGNQDVVASLLGSSHAIHLYIQSMGMCQPPFDLSSKQMLKKVTRIIYSRGRPGKVIYTSTAPETQMPFITHSQGLNKIFIKATLCQMFTYICSLTPYQIRDMWEMFFFLSILTTRPCSSPVCGATSFTKNNVGTRFTITLAS